MRRVNGKIEEITESELREIAQQQGIQYIYLLRQLQEQGAKITCDYPTEGSVQTVQSITLDQQPKETPANAPAKPSKPVPLASAPSVKAQPKVSVTTVKGTTSASTKKTTGKT